MSLLTSDYTNQSLTYWAVNYMPLLNPLRVNCVVGIYKIILKWVCYVKSPNDSTQKATYPIVFLRIDKDVNGQFSHSYRNLIQKAVSKASARRLTLS